MYDPNEETHFYQTGALSEAQIALIHEALKEKQAREAEVNAPDSVHLSAILELVELFADPSGNLIEVDGPDAEEGDGSEDDDEED